MKKVLFVLDSMNVGGTEKAFLNYIDTLPEDEYSISLLLMEKKGGFLEHVPDRVDTITLEGYDQIRNEILNPPLPICVDNLKRGRFLNAIGLFFTHLIFKITHNRVLYYRFILHRVNSFSGFDEYHAYAGPHDFISSLVAYKCHGGKRIQWIHFDVSAFGFNTSTCHAIYRKMDEVRVVSRDAYNSLITHFPSIKKKAIVCRNIVSREQCLKMANDGVGFEDRYTGIRIVTIGRLSPEKGQDIIPEIAILLKTKGHMFRWYLIGEGILRTKIEITIEKLGLSQDIYLLGEKTNPFPFLKSADLYVQTSIHEGFCLTLSEARAFNLPIVATECAGAHEQLDMFSDCQIVPRDKLAMVDAIEHFLKLLKKEQH